MIVKCDKCQTRFKIPDEKVTEKGVKVRCTRCQHTFRVARAQSAGAEAAPGGGVPWPAQAPAPAVETDPFASFGISSPHESEATRPGFFAAGVAATLPTAPSAIDLSTKNLLDGILPATASGVAPTVPSPSGPPAFDPSDPFAGIDVDTSPRPLSDFEPTSPVVPAYRPPPEAFSASDPFSLLGDAPPEAPRPLTGAPASHGSAVPQVPELLGALPPLEEEDVFGVAPDRGLFDMSHASAAGAAPGALADALGDDFAEGSQRSFTPLGQLRAPKSPATPPDGIERPAGSPEEAGIRESPPPPGPLRKVAGLVVNLAVASTLLVAVLWVGTIYVNEGRVDAAGLSLAPLQSLFTAPAELRAVDVSNGLYDTRSGRPLFYVRGEVENRGSAPATVKVRVEIVDGKLQVGSEEALLGHALSPEELYSVSSPAQLTALMARGKPGDAVLAPGKRAPFLLAFYDYPPELSQYRLKVTVERVSSAEN